MARLRIGFIINPISGTTQNKKKIILELITNIISREKFEEPEVFYTEYRGHATEIAKKLAMQGYDYVVAVGGDGTVNETAKGLIHSNSALGIIPLGSGNGLARHLGISTNAKKAMDLINNAVVKSMDYGKANDEVFFCTCGVGFDAEVSHAFANSGNRGLSTYVKATLKTYQHFSSQTYKLTSDTFNGEKEAFLIAFANASQYGNDFYIAPQASVADGLLDISILRPFPFYAAPSVPLKIVSHKANTSKYITSIRTQKITLSCLNEEEEVPFHIDGEAIVMTSPIHVAIVKGGLKVIVPQNQEI